MKEIKFLTDYQGDDEWDEIYDIDSFFHEQSGMTPDDGGICTVIVDGKTTNIHLGIWMLWKEKDTDVKMSVKELFELQKTGKKIEIEWASK